MATLSSSPSEKSVLSIEPAVVSQIVVANGGKLSLRQPTGTPKGPSGQPSKAERNGSSTRAINHGKSARARNNNTLRRVKNSKEVMRDRTTKSRAALSGPDILTTLKEGRNFTVGNVGTGGIIYLRPSTHQPTTQTTTHIFPPLTPPSTAPLDTELEKDVRDDNRESFWSTSQISEKLCRPQIRHSITSTSRFLSDAPPRPTHSRTRSFSTIESHRRSSTDIREGTLRIVIDRSAVTRPRTADMFTPPNLEVPIPHYRLGTPRFSAQGTPILRSSEYTRTSLAASNDVRASTASRVNAFSTGAFTTAPSNIPLGAISNMLSHRDPPESKAKLGNTGTAQKMTVSTSIMPGIFDDMAQKQDDPSVVRYSQRTGDVIAATPARIIAQISSASFMDYELVSDFFLTFRPYLATEDLLRLLLARLRWAINRLEDDGRIIRIRTFAALRHWILNYFMDDFVVNRKLRMQFCEGINTMYREVRRRNGGGTSDLKILQDLKRCWNGRCSLYWDSEHFIIDTHQEADIVPGGVVGSRDSSLTKLPKFEDPPVSHAEETRQNWPKMGQSWFEGPIPEQTLHGHRRETFAVSKETPASPTSEKSLQPISCSIPTKALRRTPRLPDTLNEPHPIPSSVRRQQSPTNQVLTPGHLDRVTGNAHKRSGSFTDSLRHHSSGHASSQDVLLVVPNAGSLIRGNIFPPGSPYINVSTTTCIPTAHSTSDVSQSRNTVSFHPGARTDVGHNPATKSFMGSIRRALSTRQPAENLAPPASTRSGQKIALQGRKAALPLNVSRSNDALRGEPSLAQNRTHLRIDLLCASISESYRTIQAQTAGRMSTFNEEQTAGKDLGDSPTTFDPKGLQVPHEPQQAHRLVSQATAQSGSIVIVDDTGLDIAAMSGALPVPIASQDDNDLSGELNTTTNAVMSMSPSTYLGPASPPSISQRSSGVFARRRSSSLNYGVKPVQQPLGSVAPHSSRRWSQMSLTTATALEASGMFRSTATTTSTMRRYISNQTNENDRDRRASLDDTTTSLSDKSDSGHDKSNTPAHTLRRRPGGDLRNVQNIHDLDTVSRRQSDDSDSIGGSLLIMANRPEEANKVEAPSADKPRVSLIHTHSSQHLRPSFEAAVSGFASIPDDDDGGLEATLLKLEGKYDKHSPTLGADKPQQQVTKSQQLDHHGRGHIEIESARKSGEVNQHQHVQEEARQGVPLPGQAAESPEIMPRSKEARTSSRRSSIYGLPTESDDGSEDSYNSVPLLERGLTDESMARQTKFPHPPPANSMAKSLFLYNHPGGGLQRLESSHSSIDIVEETASMKRIPKNSTMPLTERSPTVNSFLLDENENLSDLSSELSVDVINYSDVIARNPSPLVAAPGTAISGLEIPSHPLAHPPSPSSTMYRLYTPPPMNPMMFQNAPPTPDPSPPQTHQPYVPKIENRPPAVKPGQGPANAPARVSASSGHIPFILAYDSEQLAEQMTLVEKAALSEVDWSDLVNMRWDNSATSMLNWVELLSSGDHTGIDLVITRFNIMVKWTLSQIVLTQNIHERAQTIMKFIHVAAHARRLHNYATMSQITIALTSSSCTRLKKTWELVNPPERSLLKNMEVLIQPLRNFHDLRVEMETADLTNGCVPFVGLYIHDLIYNAQKPAEIAGARGSEPLVNFERYRAAATIVKGLLRLIDASSRYDFPPVEGVIDRCLWLAALADDRIDALSKALEA